MPYLNRSFAYNELKRMPQGTTIFTVVRHVSSSGMSRVVDAMLIDSGETLPLSRGLSADGFKFHLHHKYEGFMIDAVGLNMPAMLVREIGLFIHADENYFTQKDI